MSAYINLPGLLMQVRVPNLKGQRVDATQVVDFCVSKRISLKVGISNLVIEFQAGNKYSVDKD